jgi:hypothetical protein
METARRQFEIFAPEQIGVGDEEGADVDDRHEEQNQRGEIDEKRQTGEAQAVEERLSGGKRLPRRVARKIRLLHAFGDVVEEIAGDDRRHRGDEIGKRHEEPGPGEEEREGVEDGVVGAERMAGEIPAQNPCQHEPDQREERDRQGERLPQDIPQRRRKDLAPSRKRGLDQHHRPAPPGRTPADALNTMNPPGPARGLYP